MANADKQVRQQLFEWFETGDRPTQFQFEDFIHSMIIQHDDEVWVEDDDPAYDNYLGMGTTTPVGRLSLSGSAVIGAGWAGDRGIASNLIPADGMLIEGGVKIGTFGDLTDPDKYKVHIKSVSSSSPKITPHQRPLNINSANHVMAVFSDTDGAETGPYTILEEGNFGFRFYSYTPGLEQETMEITYDGRVRINVPANPEARVDVEAGSLPGMKITTTHDDQLRFDGAGSVPHTILDQSERGFRFYKEGVAERMRIANDGNVGINEPNPTYKLQVGGDVAINPGGNVFGIRPEHPLKIHAQTDETDGSVVELHPYTFSGGGPISTGEINFKSYGPDIESGFYFMQSSKNGLDYPMLIQGNGHVGVNLGVAGTAPIRPTNVMHIKSDKDNETGLRLESGGTQDHILASDSAGNSQWRDLSTFTAQGIVPARGIIMWSGAVGNIPAGWALCDGTLGTPLLSGRFIVGYSGSGDYFMDDTGGAEEVFLEGNQSGVPGHTHGHNLATGGGKADFYFWSATRSATSSSKEHRIKRGAKNGLDTIKSLDNNATLKQNAHTHPMTGSIGGTTERRAEMAHENRPPYYVLAYIMKL
jgi:microcystin-dependent protein